MRLTLLFLCVIAASSNVLQAEQQQGTERKPFPQHPPKEVECITQRVTIFNDRAQVDCTAQLDVEAGETRLDLSGLPPNTDGQNIQAFIASPEVTMQAVHFHPERVPVMQQERRDQVPTWTKEKESLQKERNAIDEQLQQLSDERRLLDQISNNMAGNVEKVIAHTSAKEMLEFFHSGASSLLSDRRAAQKKKDDLTEKIDELTKKLNEAGVMKAVGIVSVVAQAKTGVKKLAVTVSYVELAARWSPHYDVWVDSKDHTVTLSYYASVSQRSLQNWTDVEMHFSTAQPALGTEPPKLDTWNLEPHYSHHHNSGIYMKSAMNLMSNNLLQQQQVSFGHLRQESAPGRGSAEEDMAEGAPVNFDLPEDLSFVPSDLPDAVVMSSALMATFASRGLQTVNTGTTSTKVPIMQASFPADFLYSSTPKLNPLAYLKAKINNTSEYPLLAGDASVYLDNHFVSNTHLGEVAPGDSFWIWLGVDQTMKIERKDKGKQVSKHGGILSTEKKVWKYHWEYVVTNTKETPETIVVYDAVPKSSDKDIAVTLKEPKLPEPTEEGGDRRLQDNNTKVVLNSEGIMQWTLEVPAHTKRNFRVVFEVEAAAEKQVHGL